MDRKTNNDTLLAGIKLPAHLTLNPICRVNQGGFHDEACAHNYDCLRGKVAPLYPPGLGIDQNAPENVLRRDLEKSAIAGAARDPNGTAERKGSLFTTDATISGRIYAQPIDEDTTQYTAGYPRPSTYWEKKPTGYPRPSTYWEKKPIGFPRPSQYWGAAQKVPSFQGQNFGASKYWDKPQQALELPKTYQNAYALGTLPEDSTAPQQPGVLLTTSGLPAPAQSDQPPRPRNHLGQIVEQIYGVARHRKTDILAPKPVKPCANPQATSQMHDFLVWYTPETAFLDPAQTLASALHPGSEFFPHDPEMFGDGESRDGECGDEECCEECCEERKNYWVEKWIVENVV